MVKKQYAVALDMKRARSVQTDHIVVEEDNGCEFIITLTDDGQPMVLDDCTILAHFALPSGATREQTSSGDEATITFVNNVITLPLTTDCIVAGQVRCEIVVLSTNEEENDTQVTSAQFTYKVRRAIVNGDTVQASNEFPILLQALADAMAAALAANTAAGSASNAAESANEAANDADVAAGAANTAAGSASSAATAASSIAAKWGNPSISITNGDAPSATLTITADGVHLDLVVQKGADGRPAEIGDEAGILVETGEDGVLVAGRKLKVGTEHQEDVTGLRAGDIYIKEVDGDTVMGVQINGTDLTPDASGKVNVPVASDNNIGVLQAASQYGVSVTSAGLAAINRATDTMIDARTNAYRPIVPLVLNHAVKAALSDANRISDMTDPEKANARGVIGAMGGTGNIVVDNVLPASKAADLSDGDIYLYFPDMP